MVSARKWYWVHKWSSILCTAFVLVMCVTGLPLIFRDEIVVWLYDQPTAAGAGYEGLPPVDLDALIEKASGRAGLFPGQTVRWISLEDDRPEIGIGLAPSYDSDRTLDHSMKFDARTGLALNPIPPSHAGFATFLGMVLRVHQDLLLGTTGEVVMSVVAVLLLAAILSGVILYRPFLRMGFGTIRSQRSARIRWLDIHNLTGIALAAWTIVVGATGLMNETSDALYDHWKDVALASALAPYRGHSMPAQVTSVQRAAETAARAMPNMRIRSIRFPDAQLGSPQHFLIWANGKSPVTSQLAEPILVDARTGRLVPVEPVPWYLTVIQLSRPLHFGDYGGLPLKILWALIDLVTIVVLGSGLYLWIARPRRDRAAGAREDLRGGSPAVGPAK